MRINYINSLRLIATLGVILLHTSSGLLGTRDIEELDSRLALTGYINSTQFTVPLFIMISGALFLNPNKELGFKIIISKYVRRIALALLVFGLPMCVAETYLSGSGNIIDSIINLARGHSWAHMWYLYMLIGLYLITPIIKPFVEKASDKDWLAALGLMFISSSVLPTLNKFGAEIENWMIIDPYIFIYLLGYWLCWKAPKKIFGNTGLLIAAILICQAIIVAKLITGIDVDGYSDPVVICQASAIFLLFKQLNLNWTFANKAASYCFGAYLVHTVFINFAYKILHIDTASIVPFMNFMGFFLLFSILSFISSYVINKIPFLKKYVL